MNNIAALTTDGFILLLAIAGVIFLVTKCNQQIISTVKLVGTLFTIFMCFKRGPQLLDIAIKIIDRVLPIAERIFMKSLDNIYKIIDKTI